MPAPVIAVRDLVNRFGAQVVHDGVSFQVQPGEIFGIVGGSGSGKSVLLRTLLGLRRPDAGTVEIEGREVTAMDDRELRGVKRRYGVTFQHGALFTALTVAENIILPVADVLDLDEDSLERLVELRLRMVGLPLEAAAKHPAQLSVVHGGDLAAFDRDGAGVGAPQPEQRPEQHALAAARAADDAEDLARLDVEADAVVHHLGAEAIDDVARDDDGRRGGHQKSISRK